MTIREKLYLKKFAGGANNENKNSDLDNIPKVIGGTAAGGAAGAAGGGISDYLKLRREAMNFDNKYGISDKPYKSNNLKNILPKIKRLNFTKGVYNPGNLRRFGKLGALAGLLSALYSQSSVK